MTRAELKWSPSVTQQAAPPRLKKRVDVDVRRYEGDFAEACEICFVRPTALYVEVHRPDLEAPQKTGANGGRELVERRYFCAEHVFSAGMEYRS